jgi:predicted RNA binding protein YcfA (HicA-like mRNA interferase family)
MSKFDKLRERILSGRSDANISFEDLRNFLIMLGFEERIKGSHHIFRKEGIAENPIFNAKGQKQKDIRLDKSGRF